jgi:hypothetical protein
MMQMAFVRLSYSELEVEMPLTGSCVVTNRFFLLPLTVASRGGI